MYVYDFLSWLVFVSEVGSAVFEGLAEAGETIEHWAWSIVLCISD